MLVNFTIPAATDVIIPRANIIFAAHEFRWKNI
jgi:hypothetical protein